MPCIKVLMHLSGEMHCESKAACPRKQHDVSGHGLNPGPLDLDKTALTMKAALTIYIYVIHRPWSVRIGKNCAPRATLTLLSCSPNFPRASITRYTHAKHEPILKRKAVMEQRVNLLVNFPLLPPFFFSHYGNMRTFSTNLRQNYFYK